MRNLAKAFLIILIVGTSLAKAEEGKTIPEKCNFAPTAKITNTPTGLVFRSGSEVQFSGTTSTPNNCSGSITEYRWKIEGVYSYSSTKSHTFTLPAGVHEQTYSVELRVRNNASPNLYNTKTITVTVKRPQRVYHLKDHIGNVRTSVDVEGNVLGHDDYYAFGLSMPGAHSSNTSNPNDNYKFTGHERDDEAGLTIDYMNARTYDPVIGRFMQVDPLADQFPAWTPYHYVHNNPLNLIDPTGKAADPPSKHVNQMKYSLRMAFGPIVETFQNFIVPVKVTTETSIEVGVGSSNMGTGYEISHSTASTRDENGNEVGFEEMLDIKNTLNIGPVSTETSLITGDESSSIDLIGKKGGVIAEFSNGQLQSVEGNTRLGPITTGIGLDRNYSYTVSTGADKDFDFGIFYAKVKAKIKAFYRNPIEATKEDLKQFD